LKNSQKKINEIESDNNSKEYFKESKGGLVKNYAYHEESNAEFRNYMEDRGKAVENLNGDPDKIIFCIFDGHGGQQVSQFLQENFATYMKKMLPFKNHFEEITKLFKDLDEKVKELNVPLVGSTATVVYIERKNGKRMLYCANVGDSRCVLVNKKGIMRLSKDDRTDDPIERKRIIKEGGTIVNGRVDGILMLTRSFGDWRLKDSGVIVDPHIMRIELNDDDLYLIIASDGLWDAIKDEECKRITQSNPYTLEICKNFVVESLNKLSQDNISCFVISFK
jgi:serine/threonine protein phosphatase PrpC